jgi:hypothetical protein
VQTIKSKAAPTKKPETTVQSQSSEEGSDESVEKSPVQTIKSKAAPAKKPEKIVQPDPSEDESDESMEESPVKNKDSKTSDAKKSAKAPQPSEDDESDQSMEEKPSSKSESEGSDDPDESEIIQDQNKKKNLVPKTKKAPAQRMLGPPPKASKKTAIASVSVPSVSKNSKSVKHGTYGEMALEAMKNEPKNALSFKKILKFAEGKYELPADKVMYLKKAVKTLIDQDIIYNFKGKNFEPKMLNNLIFSIDRSWFGRFIQVAKDREGKAKTSS